MKRKYVNAYLMELPSVGMAGASVGFGLLADPDARLPSAFLFFPAVAAMAFSRRGLGEIVLEGGTLG